MFKPLVQYRQNRGFTLVEVSITLLIVGAIVGVVALLAPFLHDKVNELKLLSGHRQLVADLLEDFKNVRAASDLDIRDTNMNNYLIDHHLINDAYFTRDGQIYSVFSPKPVRLFIGIKRSDATQTRVLTVMYDQLAANACISLVRQEANIYCQNADTGNRPIGFRFDYNSDSAARGICDAAWLAAKTNDCRTKQNASDQHLQFFYAIPPSTYIN